MHGAAEYPAAHDTRTLSGGTMSRIAASLLSVAFTMTAAPLAYAADAPAKPAEKTAEKPAEKPKDQATLDKEFAELLTGATLVGSYNASDEPAAKEDRYDIIRAVKGEGEDWVITAKMKYKGLSVPIDITVPVKWAGD